MVDANEETRADGRPALPGQRPEDGLRSRAHFGRLRHDRIDRLWRRPTRGAPALYRWLGLVARLQRPVEPALAELHGSQHRWRRIKRGRMGQSALRRDHGGGRALRERGAARRTDEGGAEHPDRAGSACHLLWATSPTSQFSGPTSKDSSPTRCTSKPSTSTQCRGRPPDPAAIG